MYMIAAVSKNWGLGKDGELLLSIPEDMKFFREKTKGKTVVMGRKTLESFPGGRPLKGRVNIVLSRDPGFSPEGVITVRSMKEALDEIKKYSSEDVFIIGGGKIYELFEPYCAGAFITKMAIEPAADTFFPDLDKMANWSVSEETEAKEYEGISFKFIEYSNTIVKEI